MKSKPPRRADAGSVNLHTLLSTLEDSEGDPGLRRFFDEVCADTPALCDRLAAEGLLREYAGMPPPEQKKKKKR